LVQVAKVEGADGGNAALYFLFTQAAEDLLKTGRVGDEV